MKKTTLAGILGFCLGGLIFSGPSMFAGMFTGAYLYKGANTITKAYEEKHDGGSLLIIEHVLNNPTILVEKTNGVYRPDEKYQGIESKVKDKE